MYKNILNDSGRTSVIIVISSLLSSILLFIMSYEQFDSTVLQFSMLPIASVGLLYGLLPGMVCVFVMLFIDVILWIQVLGQDVSSLLGYEVVLQVLMLFFTGIISGQLHNLLKRHQQQIDEMAQNVKHYRQLIYNAKDVLYQADINGYFTFCTPMVEQLLGYTVDEFVGMHYRNVHSPKTFEEIAPIYEQQFRNRTPHIYLEAPVITKDGSSVWLGINSQLIFGEDDKVKGFQAIARNINQRKESEQALDEQQTLLRAIIDNSPNSIVVKDKDGVILLANKLISERLGKKMEDIIGRTDFELHPDPDEARRFREEDKEIIRTLKPKVILEEMVTRVGEPKMWAQTTKIPLVMEHTDERYVIVISTDITKVKEAEKHNIELGIQEERVNLLKTLISNFSHDLKTPLSVINTNLYFLKRSNNPKERQEKLDAISTQITILTNLINDALELSRLDQLATLNFVDTNINQFIRTIGNQFDAPAKQKDITIVFDLASSLESIPLSVNDFNRVVVNLLENAMRYTPQHGIIHIKTRDVVDKAIVEITDTGMGIHQEEMPFIFDRFYRSDHAQAAHSDGTGLGLAIVKEIVEMHYGSIDVNSIAGEGTTFKITLPKTHNH